MSKEAGKGPTWRKGGNHRKYRTGLLWRKVGPDARKKREKKTGLRL